mgnify:CR=1 FL=1
MIVIPDITKSYPENTEYVLMSDKEDSIFLRNFAMVLSGLDVVAMLAYVLAQAVTNNARSGYATSFATPIGVYTESSRST